MRYKGAVYRAHNPKWAFAPTSGEGARLKGGRFNPKGAAALYLSCSVQTCALEMGHGFENLFDPLTLCSYDADVEDVIDLRSRKERRAMRATLHDMGCAWFSDMKAGKQPASWTLAERLIADGASGILVPSFANRATATDFNLVLWKWSDRHPYKIVPYDPAGLLPKDQSSWR